MGERHLHDPCLKSTYKNINRVGRRQVMTSLPVRLVAAGASLPVRPQYKRTPVEHNILFFVFTDSLSGACILVRKILSLFLHTMASTNKTFKKCANPCPCFLTPDHTHDLCVFCLGEEHTCDVLEGAICVHCELFPMKKLRSRLSLFSRKEGQPSAPRGSGPSAAEARRKMSLWGSQADLAEELKKGLSLSRSSAGDEDELLDDDDVISLTSSDPAASALLGPTQEEQEMSEGEEAEAEPSLISCPADDELLEVMDRATARLDLLWKRTRKVAPRGHLDERYLSDHSPPAQTPSLPSILLQVTSRLNGKAYAAAGQAVGVLHTMAVLQTYQADLLKDLENGQGLSPEEVSELRRTTDLALRATKQVYGGHGGYGVTSVGEPGRPREEREGLSSRCAGRSSSSTRLWSLTMVVACLSWICLHHGDIMATFGFQVLTTALQLGLRPYLQANLGEILGIQPYSLKGISSNSKLGALPRVQHIQPLSGKSWVCSSGFLAEEDNVTDSRNYVPGATPLSLRQLILSARLYYDMHSPQHGSVGITVPHSDL
ncbi:hypothetical protein M9458_056479 [Cirrhinus mrigala]|uniref:Uncharacterized protein n=1 Tax=Cirrhinus mrigala TaxID=683832 RepID=A0ABD0MDW4_CIRMR